MCQRWFGKSVKSILHTTSIVITKKLLFLIGVFYTTSKKNPALMKKIMKCGIVFIRNYTFIGVDF